MENYLFGVEITSQASRYLNEIQFTHFFVYTLKLTAFLPPFQSFSCYSKGGRAIAGSELFYLTTRS